MTHLDELIELLTRDALTPVEAEAAARSAGWSVSFVAVPGTEDVSHATMANFTPALADLMERYGDARTPSPQ